MEQALRELASAENNGARVLSDEQKTALIENVLAIVRKDGEQLQKRLNDAIEAIDKDGLERLFSLAAPVVWYRNHILAPFVRDHARRLLQLGIPAIVVEALAQ